MEKKSIKKKERKQQPLQEHKGLCLKSQGEATVILATKPLPC